MICDAIIPKQDGKTENSATMLFTITFHSGKLPMINRLINSTMPSVLMPCMLHLCMCCSVSVTLYLLAPLVFSVNIAQFTPPYVKYSTSQGSYSLPFNANCEDLSCPRVAFVLHEASCRGLFVLHRRLLQQTLSLAMQLFSFDNNAGTCYSDARLLLLS